MPSAPDKTYTDGGWQGWGHWLGSSGIKKASKFAAFGQALTFARSLNLSSAAEWKVWCKEGMCPPNVPSASDAAYKGGGWQGWGHWLGSGNQSNQAKKAQFLPFDEALAVARSLNLANQKEWREWCKEGMRPRNVPSLPSQFYKDGGWQGWVHWLGSSGIKKASKLKASKFVPFEEALAAARSLSLAKRTEWQQWCKEGMRPRNVPSNPNVAYKDGGWQGWGHWLGTGNTYNTTPPLPFAEALAVARSLNLASLKEWKAWCKEGRRPPNVPSRPDQTYKDIGWQGWGHWLGTGNTRNTILPLPFVEALAVARSLNLANQFEWEQWCKEGMRPSNVPSHPNAVYKDGGWQGWGHWLGTGNQSTKTKKAQFLPFDEALRVARTLRLVNRKEWLLWCKSGARPANVPAAPNKTYVHDGWFGWEHWLYHADLDPELAPAAAAARPARKRAAPGRAGVASGNNRGKRLRR